LATEVSRNAQHPVRQVAQQAADVAAKAGHLSPPRYVIWLSRSVEQPETYERRKRLRADLEKPGKYALLCFVSDRKGGPPHVAQGMLAEITVR
jgi:hypothetical protein